MTARLPYRPEVDGLRAVAIVAVILYHLDIPAFAGGFTGVDCFFAISGYLIFSLLYREQQVAGTIDYRAFYARRITRLLPEASVLILCVVVAGYVLLAPTGPVDGDALAARRQQLAQAGAAGALWIANLHFWQYGSGYFAAWSGREPLIHLWSLGVEEQFYLMVPLMFGLTAVLSRASRSSWSRCAWILLALTFLPSIALAVAFSGKWSAFYLLPTRAYEFAVGAAVALWMAQRPEAKLTGGWAIVLAGLGLAGIASSVIWLGSAQFPGGWALLPTLSTAVVILASREAGIVHRLLTFRPIVYLGKISYGWYLWHWPLLVLWREHWLYDVSLWSQATVALAALVPAAVGHRIVAALRQRASEAKQPVWVYRFGAAGTVVTLLACGVLAWAATAWPPSPEIRAMNARMNDGRILSGECLKEEFDIEAPIPECVFGDPRGVPTVVLWGDSHAAQWVPALDAIFKRRGIRGMQRILFGCPPGYAPMRHENAQFRGCAAYSRRVLDELTGGGDWEPLAVILSARWAGYLNAAPLSVMDRWALPDGWAPGREIVESGLRKSVATLVSRGIPLGIIHSVPELRYPAPICLYRWPAERCNVPWEVQRAYLQPSIDMIGQLMTAYGLSTLDPVPAICTSEYCLAANDGAVLYSDDDHLSASAIALLHGTTDAFVTSLIAQLKASPPTGAPPPTE